MNSRCCVLTLDSPRSSSNLDARRRNPVNSGSTQNTLSPVQRNWNLKSSRHRALEITQGNAPRGQLLQPQNISSGTTPLCVGQGLLPNLLLLILHSYWEREREREKERKKERKKEKQKETKPASQNRESEFTSSEHSTSVTTQHRRGTEATFLVDKGYKLEMLKRTQLEHRGWHELSTSQIPSPVDWWQSANDPLRFANTQPVQLVASTHFCHWMPTLQWQTTEVRSPIGKSRWMRSFWSHLLIFRPLQPLFFSTRKTRCTSHLSRPLLQGEWNCSTDSDSAHRPVGLD